MTQNFFRLLFLAGISAMFFSCGSSGDRTMQTETRRFEQRFYLTDNKHDGVLIVNMRVDLPKRFHNKRVLRIIRDDIVANVFGKEFVQYSNRNLLRNFAKSLSKEYRNNYLPFLNSEIFEDSGVSFDKEFVLDAFAYGDENIFTFSVVSETAHTFFNYNLRDGSRILEEDIFIENFEPILTEIMKQHLLADLRINSIEELTGFWAENIVPNGNFFFINQAIQFVFNPYEITRGPFDIIIPFENLTEILKPNSLINRLTD